jgi:hypothetical protein
MEELIITPNESIVLDPGEGILAGDSPLRIRFGTPNFGANSFSNSEEMLWKSMRQTSGNQTAIYRRGDEFRLVNVVPETARPDSFGFEGITLTTTSRIFKVGKADLAGWLPKHGDTLEYDGIVYCVEVTGVANTFYLDVGSHGVMIRILVSEGRGNEWQN